MDIFEAILYLTLNIYHEARSENRMGQLAVAHVTLNRSEEKGLSVKEVVFEPYQFSWTHLIGEDNYKPKDMKAWNNCLKSALIAIKQPDFTVGSTYYHHENIDPYWTKNFRFIGQYGKHKFYREK